jgi:Protein of unknown function (DUF669)
MPDFTPDEDLMPGDYDEDNDFGELRVNFTDKEASSEVRKPIPRGEYHCKITDGETVACGPNSKNPGKPMWKLEFTVQDGPYEERKVYTNVMLFNGALYSLSQLMKGLGYNVDEGEFRVPKLPQIIGKDIIVSVRIKAETEQYDARNEVRGYKEYTGKTPASGEAALLP